MRHRHWSSSRRRQHGDNEHSDDLPIRKTRRFRATPRSSSGCRRVAGSACPAFLKSMPQRKSPPWVAVTLLWLAGNALRLTILAVPPVIAMIRDEFSMSATEVGLLSSIPPALFAVAALIGSLLVARLGVKGALFGGLVLIAVGSALRGLSTGSVVLFATTIVMSAGVAIMQPIMPTTVRQ